MRSETTRSTIGPYASAFRIGLLLVAVFLTSFQFSVAQTSKKKTSTNRTSSATPPAVIERGQSAFAQDCAFCHGRDAGGGEAGPDLTRSKLVASDVGGDKIGPVIRNGTP
jgi:cytochrome c oxidase cbb3-type subunit 3